MTACAVGPNATIYNETPKVPSELTAERWGVWNAQDDARLAHSEAVWAEEGLKATRAKSSPGELSPYVIREGQEGLLEGKDPTPIIKSRNEMTATKAAQGVLYGRKSEGYKGRAEAEDLKTFDEILKAVPAFKHRELWQTVQFIRDTNISQKKRDRVLLDLAEYVQRFFAVKEQLLDQRLPRGVSMADIIEKIDQQYRDFFIKLGFDEKEVLFTRGKGLESAYSQMKRLKDFMQLVLGKDINVDHHLSIGASGRRQALEDIRVMVKDIRRAVMGRLAGFKNLKLLFEKLNKSKGKKFWKWTSRDHENMFSSIFADAYQQASKVKGVESLPTLENGVVMFLKYAGSKGGKLGVRKQMMSEFGIDGDVVSDFFKGVDATAKLILEKKGIKY